MTDAILNFLSLVNSHCHFYSTIKQNNTKCLKVLKNMNKNKMQVSICFHQLEIAIRLLKNKLVKNKNGGNK